MCHQTNRTLFNLEQLPARLLVIGAGPIGLEVMARCPADTARHCSWAHTLMATQSCTLPAPHCIPQHCPIHQTFVAGLPPTWEGAQVTCSATHVALFVSGGWLPVLWVLQMAQAFAIFGSDVVVVDRADRILRRACLSLAF